MYLWIKSLHVIAIISWMAGILYLYRVLVNLFDERANAAPVLVVLGGMADRLYRIITVPAMVVSWLAGLAMLGLNPGLLSTGSMHVKLAAVVILTALTLYAGRIKDQFLAGDFSGYSSKKLRLFNEFPTLMMFIIVVMIIVRPFG